MSVQTMAAVWRGSKHSGSALLMMLAIADFSDDKGQAFPAVSTLAEKTRMKPRNANYLLADLQASGELDIKIGAGRNGTNLYRIRLDRLQGLHPGAGVQPSAGVQPVAELHHSARGAATQCSTPLHSSADKPSLNHQEPSGTSLSRPKAVELDCPQEGIRALYAELLPTLPFPKKWDADRQRALRTCWRERSKEKSWASVAEGLNWFRRFFTAVSENDWAMGRSRRSNGHENWECNIDYLLSPKGFRRIIESSGRAREAA
jgi:hypothetical protein